MSDNNQEFSSLFERLDLYSLLRDVARNLWAILLGAIAIALIANVFMRSRSQSTYSTQTTFVVSSRTSSNYAYSNLNAASNLANSASSLLNSSIMRKKVCKDLGVKSIDATMSASVIEGTNLLVLNVRADTPQNTYMITRSIMRNISGLLVYVSDDVVMDVLQEPMVPSKADASASAMPRTKKIFVLAFVVLTLAFMYLSYRKQTIKSEKDLDTLLNARSLGLLYHNGGSFKSLFKKNTTANLVTDPTTSFDYVERVRKTTAHLMQQAERHKARVILVTSLMEHEGKSTTAANLALTLSRQGHETLLIDCDMRRPTQQRFFLKGKERLRGTLYDLLIGKADKYQVMLYDKKKNIHLMLNSHNIANSTDLVSSEQMKVFVEDIREEYEYVIIDSPPMALMADAEALADLADLSILVVKYDHALADDLNDTIDALKDCQAHFAGCILNDVRSMPGTRRMTGGYGGYGRYGRYGAYGRYGDYAHYGRSVREEETL